jgi:hypothetical protein
MQTLNQAISKGDSHLPDTSEACLEVAKKFNWMPDNSGGLTFELYDDEIEVEVSVNQHGQVAIWMVNKPKKLNAEGEHKHFKTGVENVNISGETVKDVLDQSILLEQAQTLNTPPATFIDDPGPLVKAPNPEDRL